MTSAINQTALIRGADGRLFSITNQGVAEVAEQATVATAAVRAADRGFNNDDQQAGRYVITPGF